MLSHFTSSFCSPSTTPIHIHTYIHIHLLLLCLSHHYPTIFHSESRPVFDVDDVTGMQGTIHVSKQCERHAITTTLLRQKIHLELDPDGRTPFDFRGASVCFLIETSSTLDDMRGRVHTKDRLLRAKDALASQQQLVLLVLMTTVDPSQDVLNWLNVECGIELAIAVVLCWSDDEAATFVQHARTSTALSLDYAGGVAKKDEAHLPTLIDAFTQSPQILTRPDVVRLCNRHRTVADFLSSTPDVAEGVPGMGKRKADRLHGLLNTPFTASTERVSDVLKGVTNRPPTVPASADSASSSALAAMEAARRRREAQEEEESGND